MRTGLIGQEQRAAGTDICVGATDSRLIMRREIVADRERTVLSVITLFADGSLTLFANVQ
jgi:hypothetical protein